MDPKSRPNSSEVKKKMEMINPGKNKASSKSSSKPIPSKKLQKVSNSNSPSTSLSDFSFNRPISASEKQQLSLLATDPLNFSATQTDTRSEGLKFIQSTLESMMARNKERELEEAYEEMLESLDQSEQSERLERMKKLNDFVESLKNKTDEDGNLLITLPENYDEILETAVEYRKMHNKDPDVSWMEIYSAQQEHEKIDEEYRKRREKIKKLDLVLKEKEKMLRDLKTSRSSVRSEKNEKNESLDKDSFFLTKVKTRSVQKKVYSEQDFIKKNTEYIEEMKQGLLVSRLTAREQERLAEIERNLDKKDEPFQDILMNEEQLRLEEIDKALRTYIPQIEWEEKSISTDQYKKQPKKEKVKPGDPVLREAQERREVFSEMNKINSRLLELQNKPVQPIHEDDLKELLVEHGYDFSQNKVYRYDPLEDIINQGKDVLENIENLDKDLDSITQTVQESNEAIKFYEDVMRKQAEDLVKTPEYLLMKQKIISKLDEEQNSCKDSLIKIDDIEKKLRSAKQGLEETENLEKYFNQPIDLPDYPQPSIEDIDQEITSKIEENLSAFKPNFSDLDDITPENFPMLYYVYERVLGSNSDLSE